MPYLEIFLKSLFEACPDCPDVFIYHTDLNKKQLCHLKKYPTVKTVCLANNDFIWGPSMATHRPKLADPRISYARFLIWTDQMKNYENVVHLDTDLLILGRLDELFNTDRFTIFAETYQAEDACFYNPLNPGLLNLLEEDGIQPPVVIANCGVFTVPKKDRTPEDFEMLCYLLKRYAPYVKWADQSIINLWMAKKGINITPGNQFNFQHRLVAKPGRVPGLSEVKIFHFNGVDLRYRLFLVRCANFLRHLPWGWDIYRLVFRVAYGLLHLWRSMNSFRFQLKTSRGRTQIRTV